MIVVVVATVALESIMLLVGWLARLVATTTLDERGSGVVVIGVVVAVGTVADAVVVAGGGGGGVAVDIRGGRVSCRGDRVQIVVVVMIVAVVVVVAVAMAVAMAMAVVVVLVVAVLVVVVVVVGVQERLLVTRGVVVRMREGEGVTGVAVLVLVGAIQLECRRGRNGRRR